MRMLIVWFFSGLDAGGGVGGMQGAGGEDLITLEAEITELQRENARVESQMLRLRTDITAMEAHLRHGDKVGPVAHRGLLDAAGGGVCTSPWRAFRDANANRAHR